MKLVKVDKVDDKLLEEIVERILKVLNPVKIILFGSYAYGEAKKGSDIDLLIVVENEIESRRKIASEIYGVLCGILIPKDIVVAKLADIEDWKNVPQAFISKIVKKGKVLYER